MPPRPKTSVVPPGGFHFIEKHGGVEIKIESTSTEAVAEALLRYRLNNGIPAGNPQQEVFDYVCNNWPNFCTENDEPYLTPIRPPSREEHLSRRVANWMVKLWSIGAQNEVQPAEAARRAAICAACPLNQDFHGGACAPCVESVERLGFIWRRQRTTPSDPLLKGCRACGQLNVAAVQAGTLPPLTPEDSAALASDCWRK